MVGGVRHNFVNDIGDYAKYALLRALCASSQGTAHLGVIWYLTDHIEHNNDGRKRAHLLTAGWEDLDPDLLTTMRRIEGAARTRDQLNVNLIETSDILPPDTAYFSEPVPRVRGTAAERSSERAAWFERARKAMARSNLVFLDPDNGLAVRSVPVTSPQSNKYATAAEIAALLETGSGVVLYQHGSRMTWQAQRQDICIRIAAATDLDLVIRTLRFGAFGARAFFCVTGDREMAAVIEGGFTRLRQQVAAWDKSSYLLIE